MDAVFYRLPYANRATLIYHIFFILSIGYFKLCCPRHFAATFADFNLYHAFIKSGFIYKNRFLYCKRSGFMVLSY